MLPLELKPAPVSHLLLRLLSGPSTAASPPPAGAAGYATIRSRLERQGISLFAVLGEQSSVESVQRPSCPWVHTRVEGSLLVPEVQESGAPHSPQGLVAHWAFGEVTPQ